jgi:hypothetical protein
VGFHGDYDRNKITTMILIKKRSKNSLIISQFSHYRTAIKRPNQYASLVDTYKLSVSITKQSLIEYIDPI